jgi:hypothetical protein
MNNSWIEASLTDVGRSRRPFSAKGYRLDRRRDREPEQAAGNKYKKRATALGPRLCIRHPIGLNPEDLQSWQGQSAQAIGRLPVKRQLFNSEIAATV